MSLLGEESAKCSVCDGILRAGDVTIKDHSSTQHLDCWDATTSDRPFIKETLAKRTHRTRLDFLSNLLCNPNAPIRGWDSMSCSSRVVFIVRMLISKKCQAVTAKEIVEYFPCHSCPTCTTPQWCSFKSYRTSCCAPDLQPAQCSNPLCQNTVHRQCQLNFERLQKSTRDSLVCMDCSNRNINCVDDFEMPQTRSRTSGTTRRFPSRQSTRFNNPAPISSTPCKLILFFDYLLLLLCPISYIVYFP